MSQPTAGQPWTHPMLGAVTLIRRAVSGHTAPGHEVVGWDYVGTADTFGWLPERMLIDDGTCLETQP